MYIFRANILYHLRRQPASGTDVLAGCYFYTQKEDDLMPTAKKLPSGSWRCQVFSHYEEVKQSDGTIKKKRIYKSFTSDDPSRNGKKAAELAAAQWAATRKGTEECRMTFREAAEEYIRSRESVLSPGTIKGYRAIVKNDIGALENIKIPDVKQADIQKCINENSPGR